MSQDSGTAATLTQGGSVVVSGAAGSGRTATPNAQPTAVNIATSTYPSISNLLNHAGLRYPMCATVQGGSLIYSPMMGQTLFPWRPFTPVATPTTPVSAAVMPNVNLISPPTQTTPSKQVSLAPLIQMPSYSYMAVSSLLGGSGTGGGGGNSSSSPTSITHHQHSGITIKRENSEPIDHQSTKRLRLTNETASDANNSSIVLPSQGSPAASRLMHSGGSSTSSPTDLAPYQHLQYPPSALLRVNSEYYSSPPVNNVLLLKCLGLVDSTVIDQYNIKALSLMQDLYIPPRPGFNSTPPALPPETYILLTINYLNSLRLGECVSIEMMRWVFYNTLMAENQWVSYYRKHKKMTESTFVQLQFSHFTRILSSSQGNLNNVSVVVSQNSLSEGIFLAVQSILKTTQAKSPKFYAVVAVLQNIPSEMCIIVTDQLHCKWLLELQQSVKSLSAIKEPIPQPLVFSRDILTSMKRSQTFMGGRVYTPFLSAGQGGGRDELITMDEADKLLPSLSSVVEHRPVGPFTELYDMAVVMLQKVLSTGHLDRFQKLDFFIICPNYPPLATQLVKDVQESGLIQLLGFGDHRDEIHRAINQRIVMCKAGNIEAMNETISSNKHVLYLVISKCSHMTSCVVLSHRVVESDPGLESNTTTDCKSILSHTNVSILYTSAQPYALQTNRAFVPAGNEIHWSASSAKQQTHSNHEMSSGLEFCSLLRHKSTVPVNAWANVREDVTYEEKVLSLCNSEKLTTPISQIRAQVLLNDYSSALLSITKKKSSDMLSSLPETLGVVYDLVQRPLGNSRGRGSMVIIRCHNKAVGINLFNKLRGVRKTLGLQYRFEVILDHGEESISISEYFLKRLRTWGVAIENKDPLSYLDLDHLPCLVVMTGKVRPSIRLPSSLSHVDLRLCHAHLTRTIYDSDMALANSYRTVSSSVGNGGMSHHSKQHSPITSYKSDQHHLSTASSSSMISNEAHVVEWKPSKDITGDHTHWDKNVRSPSSSYKAQFEYSSADMDCTTSPAINGGVAIVEIPQPEDHMTTSFNEPSSSVAVDTEESIFNDLDSDSDYGDSEAENDDGNQRKITCLLSRQYYLIWRSGDTTVDQSLLIPPSVGITWQASSKWTHLSDQTPSGQSSYYRTWSKPEGKAKRVAMDTIIKENSEARQRCYLLTGPNQIGKLGSCLLLIRLIHDYLRSYRGVTAITRLPVLLPFIKTTPPSSPMVTTFSPVVSLDYLTSIHESDAPPSPSSNYSMPHPLAPSDIKPSTVQINAHSTMIHDASHSCSKCFSSTSAESKSLPPSFHLSSLLQCDSISLTIQWCVPSSKTKLVTMTSNQTLECIKLPQVDPSLSLPDVPIISISPDHKESALLNMSHTAEHSPHIIITKTSNFASYIKSWPQHIIAALPDAVFQCLGYQMHAIQALLHWNYLLNTVRTNSTSSVLPWALVLSDTVCMVLRDGEDSSVDLSDLVKELITEEEADLISMRPWCHEPRPHQSHDYALDSNFLLLNMAKLKGISYNPLNFKSADLDYHLRLLSNGYKVHMSNHYTFVKKHVKLDSPTSLANLPDNLISHPDRLVASLHHDTSSLLSYPGPLLLEEFLLHKSKSLFSSAHSPVNPVLMIEHYINLGPQVNVSLWTCRELEDRVNQGDSTIDSTMFGGLALYLCEGLVSSQLLQKLKFVKGACLLLITRDCKGLVREVSRLDIEEYWHFKLRDEFQTACSDQNQPLFFLTGKYVSSNV